MKYLNTHKMNRRNFFKTIGIPSLALPFYKIFQNSEPNNIITYEARGLELKWATSSHWASTAKSSWITTICPYCYIHKFVIPIVWHSVKPWQKRFWFIRHTCKVCNKSYIIGIRISEIPNYFNVRYFLDDPKSLLHADD